jgi:hypothetical protein
MYFATKFYSAFHELLFAIAAAIEIEIINYFVEITTGLWFKRNYYLKSLPKKINIIIVSPFSQIYLIC